MDVLEVADKAVSTGPLCDACLGRLVADRSFGLGNDNGGKRCALHWRSSATRRTNRRS
jgi:Predicted pseudouridylate synthase